MAPIPTKQQKLSIDALSALGAEKLARIVLDEAEANPGFRKLVKAALAGTKGAEAISKLVDRRLAGLEKARAMVDWQKERAFADDLSTLVRMITGELADQDRRAAVERLLRFVATHASVFERIDDSGGRIQGIYAGAVGDCGRLFTLLAESDRSWLPEMLTRMLSSDTHGLTEDLVARVAPLLGKTDRLAFDKTLAGMQEQAFAGNGKASRSGGTTTPTRSGDGAGAFMNQVRVSAIIAARQSLADADGDIDGFIKLENAKFPHMRDTHAIALRLHQGNRHAEALKAIRAKGGLRPADVPFDWQERIQGSGNPLPSLQRVRLEAEILTSLGDRPAAQTLRWHAFERLLDAGLLNEHIAAAGDFSEFEIRDRAVAVADGHADPYRALAFYLALSDLPRAAALVVARSGEWDGARYYELPEAARTLEHDHPLAASILYRALMTDILDRARSKAYGHAARYLARLDDLAASVGVWPANVPSHDKFRATLKAAHARKTGFWAQISG